MRTKFQAAKPSCQGNCRGVGYGDHCKPIFKNLYIVLLLSLYIYVTLLGIYGNRAQFSTHAEVHNHHTRKKRDLRTPCFRLTKTARNSLDVKLFNHLPNNLKLLDNDMKFKSSIKMHFLTHCFYSVEEYMQ